ncbi:helix-turn-helix domain-containing protein [Thermoactinospora rubra]|uniref:helix-turn-helix domain-containing protein n=1 Tax=Thermoactinospora rubra TaxID=1088767 RepID=UPI000A10D2E4|nr:helix-turn-helix domain-containing protein [Thermoactinospora rubra]
MAETWTIGELARRAADALGPAAQPVNGRVREVPGERLIRWYTTIGLVDPPLTRRGRIARYGRRHLLQLVAVKRLQAEGRSIAEIQAALAGATDAVLERIAGVPDAAVDGEARPHQGEAPLRQAAPARTRFWARPPVPAAEPPAPAAESSVPTTTSPPSRTAGEAGPLATLPALRLAPGVTLLLDGARRTPSTQDIEAVLAAAGPLVEVLEARRLL